jgi:hypothetical protein
MDHADLPEIVSPIQTGEADYVKGNRLIHGRAEDMPTLRRWGTQCLAWLTSLACRVKLGDSQCGYTAISRRAAAHLDWTNLWEGYGYPNDLLITLAARGLRIVERPVRPVYATEKSGLRPWHVLSIVRVILRRTLLEWRSRPAQQRELPAVDSLS